MDGKIKDPQATSLKLNCGESGTTLRFLLPMLAAVGREARITAEGSLVGRPMQPFIDELNRHGACIRNHIDTRTSRKKNSAGDVVTTKRTVEVFDVYGILDPGIYKLPGDISSQFVSGLMLAKELADDDIEIEIDGELQSAPYVRMTEAIIQAYQDGRADEVLEGDWSSGAMWVVANDLLGGKLRVYGLKADSLQGDNAIIDILNDYAVEEVLTEMYGSTGHMEIDAKDCPDIVPAIVLKAVSASLGETPVSTVIRNVDRLKYKESNRLEAIAEIMSELGANIHISDDGNRIEINPVEGDTLLGSDRTINTHNDHRMVMLATMASIICEKPVTVDGIECVAKSYPSFFEDIARLGGVVE